MKLRLAALEDLIIAIFSHLNFSYLDVTIITISHLIFDEISIRHDCANTQTLKPNVVKLCSIILRKLYKHVPSSDEYMRILNYKPWEFGAFTAHARISTCKARHALNIRYFLPSVCFRENIQWSEE